MTDQQFTYWLQGFAELNGDTPPTAEQWKSIREHLALCFTKVTPPVEIKNAPLLRPPVLIDLENHLKKSLIEKNPADAVWTNPPSAIC